MEENNQMELENEENEFTEPIENEKDKEIAELEKKIIELQTIIDEISTEVAESFYQTIQILATILSSQEYFYDNSHSRFVSQKSAEVATRLGMNEDEVFQVSIGGLLHDIGKVGFKDTLRAKFTSEMKDSEYRQYIMHPEIGRQILKKHKGFQSIEEIVFQHHEKIDGSGFPMHLQGKEIHPGAAIVAVVNTYHNAFYKRQKEKIITPNLTAPVQITNPHSYLESTQGRFSSAMNYLHQKKGVLFDTKVVEVFTEIIERDRKLLGQKTLMRLPISKLEKGMIIAEDYYTSFGLLIASRGEEITEDVKNLLLKLAETGELPYKILVMK